MKKRCDEFSISFIKLKIYACDRNVNKGWQDAKYRSLKVAWYSGDLRCSHVLR